MIMWITSYHAEGANVPATVVDSVYTLLCVIARLTYQLLTWSKVRFV